MTVNTHLKRILIYPIKSLEGISLTHVAILPSGALKNDRRYAICHHQYNAIADKPSQFVNGKNNPKIHKLRSIFNSNLTRVSLQIQDTEEKFFFDLHEEIDYLLRQDKKLNFRLGISCSKELTPVRDVLYLLEILLQEKKPLISKRYLAKKDGNIYPHGLI